MLFYSNSKLRNISYGMIRNMTEHTLDIFRLLDVARPAYFWKCSCDAHGSGAFESKEQTTLEAYRHVYPDIPRMPHAPSFSPDSMGMETWYCSCGAESRIGGYVDERRSRQSHTRHAQSSILREYKARGLADARHRMEKDLYAKAREHMTPAVRAEMDRRDLENLL